MVFDHGLFVDLSVRLAKDFKRVLYYCPSFDPWPSVNPTMIGYGLEGIEVVQDPYEHLPYVDLCIFPDVGFADIQEHMVDLGKAVWGSRKGELLELDRELCKEVMEEIRLPVGKFQVVKGIKKLTEFLKKNKDQYVKISRFRGLGESFFAKDYKSIEPRLDKLAYDLGPIQELQEFDCESALPDKVELGTDIYIVDGQYPSKSLMGWEIKDAGYCGLIKPLADYPKAMNKVTDALSPVMEDYGYRGFFSTEVRIGKDGKPFLIDMTCYSDDTEVLTLVGWKRFSECLPEDSLATLNVGTNEIQYQKPSSYLEKDFKGEMVLITNRDKTIECLVTPDHDVLRTDRHGKKTFKQKAGALTDKGFIPRTGEWRGSGEEFFCLPEYHHEWDFIGQYGHKICTRVHHEPELKIPMPLWAEFMGWYLSEGSCSKNYVCISQTKYQEKVRDLLNRLPFSWSEKNTKPGNFQILSMQLNKYLKPMGTCSHKKVPEYIKVSSPEVLEAFLSAYCFGDGSHRDQGGSRRYFTTSRRMADDIQELILKTGSASNIQFKKVAGTSMTIAGKTYIRNHDSYTISENKRDLKFWFETGCRKDQYIKSIPYDGKVYCATVPNGTLFVRRNGKPFWSGNCRLPSPPWQLYCTMYKNLAEIIWEGANGNLVDPYPAAKFGAILMIKSDWADNERWCPVDYPKELRPFIRIANGCIIDNQHYSIPLRLGLKEIGAVCGMGGTMEEAIKNCRENASQVGGCDVKVNDSAMDDALSVVEEAKSYGIDLL